MKVARSGPLAVAAIACSHPCTARIRSDVAPGRRAVRVPAGSAAPLELDVSRALARKVARSRRGVKAKLRIQVVDAAGRARRLAAQVRLVRGG